MSEAVTQGVRVEVTPTFHPERSDPGRRYWFFSYAVTITNEGPGAVQLLSRHWIITDGLGQVQHVRGPGVVGEQPVIAPGRSFAYQSACPLPTAVGTMQGTYEMRRADGSRFDAEIAPFLLADPEQIH